MLNMKAYKFMLRVTKFQLRTIYSFSTAERKTWLWVDSAPPPGLLGLKGESKKHSRLTNRKTITFCSIVQIFKTLIANYVKDGEPGVV